MAVTQSTVGYLGLKDILDEGDSNVTECFAKGTNLRAELFSFDTTGYIFIFTVTLSHK